MKGENLRALRAGYRVVKRVIRHGPEYPWRRYIATRKVFDADAIHTDTSGDVTVCVLTSSDDWFSCLWSLVSFYRFTGLRFPVLIYSDGSLRQGHAKELTRVFPNARFIDSSEGDSMVADELSHYPNCARFRGLSPYARKIIDFPVLSKSKSILILDSDVLFFRRPDELVELLEGESSQQFVFQRDSVDSYFDSRENIQKVFDVQIASRVNSGIVIADVEQFDYARLDSLIGRGTFEYAHHWAEQTLWAMYAGVERTILLSEPYDLTMSTEIKPDTVMKHYVKPIRDFIYTDGIPRLISEFHERGVFRR